MSADSVRQRSQSSRFLARNSIDVEANSRRQPRTIYTSTFPVFYIYKAVGLACYSSGKEHDRTTYKYSSLGAVYNLVILGVVLLLAFFSNYTAHSNTYKLKSEISKIEDLFEINTAFLLTILFLFSARNQANIISSFSKLHSVDVALGEYYINIPHKTNRMFLIAQSAFGTFFLVMLMIHSLTILFTFPFVSYSAVYAVGFYITKYINMLANFQFIAWILAIRQRFVLINDRLGKPELDLVILQEFPHLHASLCDVAKAINQSFSSQMLITTGACFVALLGRTYSFIVTLIYIQVDSYFYHILIYQLSWSIWSFLTIFVICLVCSSTTNEAMRSGEAVHAALRRNNKDPLLKLELQTFSSQLLHHQVKFTAFGFFPLDLSLVHRITATVTTYIIILVQFNLALPEEQKSAIQKSISLNEGT